MAGELLPNLVIRVPIVGSLRKPESAFSEVKFQQFIVQLRSAITNSLVSSSKITGMIPGRYSCSI